MYRKYVHRYFYLRGKLTYLRASHSRSSNDFLYHLHLVMSDQLWLPPSSAALPTARPAIRQHTSAYVSIRQHTSAYVSIRQHAASSFLGCLPTARPARHFFSSRKTHALYAHTLYNSLYRIRYAYVTHTHTLRIRYACASP
jgi:hypothetical protein